MVLRDPAEVKQYARRGDPPIARWPGRVVTRRDLMAASGDPRDWFRYGHRLNAYEDAWMEFVDARRRRRNFTSGFEWNQILVLGDYGSGKTTLAIHMARHFFGLGHPVFSNASCLFGWHLEHEEMYTAMGFMPKNSVLLIDESSAALASRVGHGVAVSSFAEMNLNTRKQNCVVIYMSAQDWEISTAIRRSCKEVWMPVGKDNLGIETGALSSPIAPANDPDNFRLAWHVWDDYPYRKANLIEGPDPEDKWGFGPPSYTMFDEGELVRRALLLNDTFELAQAGAATTANRDAVKESLGAFLDGRGPAGGATGGPNQQQDRAEKLLLFFQHHEADPPPFFRAADIARALSINSAQAGKLIQELIPVSPINRRGYPSNVIYDYLAMVNEQTEAHERNGYP